MGDTKTTVGNIRDHRNWKAEGGVYIGRSFRGQKASRFANPYIIGMDGDRDEVIFEYRQWFYRQICAPGFRRAVEELRGKMLVCWCAPKKCHGDVIVEHLERSNDAN